MCKKQRQKNPYKGLQKNRAVWRKNVLGWLSRPGNRHGPASMPGRPAKPAQPARSTASQRARGRASEPARERGERAARAGASERASLARGGLGREMGWGAREQRPAGPAGLATGLGRAGCRPGLRANRPGSRPGPGWMPVRRPSQPACQPAWAGLDAGWATKKH